MGSAAAEAKGRGGLKPAHRQRDILDRVLDGVDQAEGKNQQDNQAHDGIEPVFFQSESDDRERNARDGCGDQQQQAKLDEAFAVYVGCGLQNSCDRLGGRTSGRELAIADGIGVVDSEVEDAADKDDGRCKQDSRAQQVADDEFRASCRPLARSFR